MKKKSFLYILLALFGLFLLFQPPVDPDFGWHYKYGEFIFQNLKILRENTFSHTFANYSWANSYWLSQLVMFTLARFTGVVGMSFILSTLLVGLCFYIFSHSKLDSTGFAVAVLPIFTFLGVFLVTVRPMFFSSAFFLVLAWILMFGQQYKKWLPLLFLVWANMHADFMLGLFVFGVFTLFESFSLIKQKKISLSSFFKLGISPFLSFLATFVNPYGYKLWETLFKETHYFQFNQIGEWIPVSLRECSIYALMIMLWAFVLSALIARKKKNPPWYIFSVLFFFVLSLRAVYFARPFFLLGIFCAASFWGDILNSAYAFFDDLNKKRLAYGIVILLIFGVFVLAFYFAANIYYASDIKRWSEKFGFPYGAVSYIKNSEITGNMFNTYNWGGFLIWQLPEHKTFVDGRMPSWRDGRNSVFEDYVRLVEHLDQNIAVLGKYDVEWILVDWKKSPLALDLLEFGGWDIVYGDEYSVVLRKIHTL